MKLTKLLPGCCVLFMILSCNNRHTFFEKISPAHSGIYFENKIVENDSINPLDVVNIYNGGGVGVGDFNNDGKQDIFFTGNMVPCKLYLNKGGFKFEDITKKAGVDGMNRWARGVSIIDINNDGLPDIYICNTIYSDSMRRRNILYVNQGPDDDGIPHFKDEAAAYGLDINVQSTMATFFDYDNDGDLDMYLTVNEASTGYDQSVFSQRDKSTDQRSSTGRLYRNDWNSALKHSFFHDVSTLAGIVYNGYGHAATICDINNDGWKDIYVSDDFISNNILYINNHDGTFTNRTKEYFKHTSFNSMGQDITDINNDGLPDVIELDMAPQNNLRKKMISGANSYITYQNFESFGYQYQYVRNTLQLNQGPSLKEGDSIGNPAFSDISFLSGIAQTDWSWTPLVADFDNDSYRDIIITNGFPKDVSDHDFVAYRKDATGLASKKEIISQIPQVKIHNYAYHNNGDLTFTDESGNWGFTTPTFSNGAAYADLDNDGYMDVIINNINDKAFVFRNTGGGHEDEEKPAHFMQIKFKGTAQNINGIGAVATIYYSNKKQVYENNPYRGYLSTMPCMAHFGLGKTETVDSIIIQWNNTLKQKLTNIKADQTITVNINDASPTNYQPQLIDSTSLFKEITKASNINFSNSDFDFIDFNIQKLLPHKLSEYTPALAAGDVDGNGLDDIIIGSNPNNHAQIFLQQADGKFIQKDISPKMPVTPHKDEGILMFDANGDGKPDVYISSGGYQFQSGAAAYQDHLYINDGNGNFKEDTTALPKNYTSKLCVRAFDYNNDGKLDLFISGRVDPWHYPKPVSSCILRNDSKNGKALFTDVTNAVAPQLNNIGLVCDALFTDFDGDGKTDLLLAGEWMPVTFLKNENGKFKNVTASTGIANKTGWWNSIVAGDFRHTGRTDYIVGNVGLNTLYQASDEYPVYITAKDFDGNGNYDAIPSIFFLDSTGIKKEFPAFGRDDMIKEMISIKRRFPTYHSFGVATMDSVITPAMRKDAIRLKVNTSQSCFLRNDGNGKFTIIPLPLLAQVSTLNGMIADDFDGDGNLDVLLNGNDYGTEVSVGRYDAFNSLLLKGNGKGDFQPLSILQSGVYIPGDGKALVKLEGAPGKYLVAASQHKGALKLYALRKNTKIIKVKADDINAIIHYKNGSIEKKEFYYGSSFLSQSSRFFTVNNNISSINITNSKGETRSIDISK